MIKILLILCVILFSAHATPAKTKSMRFRRKSMSNGPPGPIGQKWQLIQQFWTSNEALALYNFPIKPEVVTQLKTQIPPAYVVAHLIHDCSPWHA